MTASPNGLTYQVTLNSGQVFTVNTAIRPTRTFWGVTSDTPITFADFAVLGTTNGNSTAGLMDNFRYGTTANTAAATPEVSTMLLIGTGLIGIRLLRKLRLPPQDVAA
jgi:hypothetical protein